MKKQKLNNFMVVCISVLISLTIVLIGSILGELDKQKNAKCIEYMDEIYNETYDIGFLQVLDRFDNILFKDENITIDLDYNNDYGQIKINYPDITSRIKLSCLTKVVVVK